MQRSENPLVLVLAAASEPDITGWLPFREVPAHDGAMYRCR